MTIAKAEASQFQLDQKGQVLFQKTANNPVPGTPIAQLEKGEHILKPVVKITAEMSDEDAQKTQDWVTSYIGETLEYLKIINECPETHTEPVREICKVMGDTLGACHRSKVQDYINELDEEARALIRGFKIKLGPILVFLPALTKPKSVRLRALLWSLWNGKELPASVPSDGAVSVTVNVEEIDTDYYRAISYPVFGPRAIRIDMLDRVLNEIYETAEQGKFQAQHKMAEWLGCSIEDLYAILSAMGHVHIKSEPKEEAEGKDEEQKSEDAPASETDEKKEPEGAQSAEDVKPELDMFYLKKGQAHKPRQAGSGGSSKSQGKPQRANKKPKKGKGSKPKPRMVSNAPAPKPEDSPFAILEQLKKGQSK